jgi:hypothetical protein
MYWARGILIDMDSNDISLDMVIQGKQLGNYWHNLLGHEVVRGPTWGYYLIAKNVYVNSIVFLIRDRCEGTIFRPFNKIHTG